MRREDVQSGAEVASSFAASASASMPRSTPEPDVRSELIDLLSGQRIGENACHAVLGVERGPVARGVVADGEGTDVPIVQIGEAFVETLGVIGGAVVAALEALREVELQPRLETEDDVAERRSASGRALTRKTDTASSSVYPVDAGGLRRRAQTRRVQARRRGDIGAALFGTRFAAAVAGIRVLAAAPRVGCAASRAELLRGAFGFSPRASAASRTSGKRRLIEARLGHVVAPGDTRLQWSRSRGTKHGQAERGRFERADGWTFGRGRRPAQRLSSRALLHAFAAALRLEQSSATSSRAASEPVRAAMRRAAPVFRRGPR